MNENNNNNQSLEKARRQMVNSDLLGRGITDERILAVMEEICREEFVPDKYSSAAYSDGPLPIGCGQTISQPYIVALMTQQLKVNDKCEILEIGTGSGYQTAILAKLAKKVYTVEVNRQLAESAQAVLGRMGYSNIEYYIGDGSAGWYEEKEFDGIMVTAAVPSVPEPLKRQLKPGGIMAIPVGGSGYQRLMACEKKPVGLVERFVCDVRFVRLIGEYGFEQ